MSEKVRVALKSDIAPGASKLVEAGGKEIALFNVDGQIFATSNICPHQGGPLADGFLEGTNVICPWHAWAFDVQSGENPMNPRLSVETYPVEIEGEEVFVTV